MTRRGWWLVLSLACSSGADGEQAYCSAQIPCAGSLACDLAHGRCVPADQLVDCATHGADDVLAPGLAWVVVSDRSLARLADCAHTRQPGVDLDAVLLYRTCTDQFPSDVPRCACAEVGGPGKRCVMAVGKPGTAVLLPPDDQVLCESNDFNDVGQATGGVDATGNGPGGQVSGFVSLNGGSVAMQLGACSPASDPSRCDGLGPPVVPVVGDEMDVYEVDGWYSDPATAKFPTTCKCVAEPYRVALRLAADVTASEACLGRFTGTTSRIRVR
jgi:hypothetical protein